MRKSDIIYWVYAVVNSLYGKSATITRDNLRFIYPQHRFNIDVRVQGVPSQIVLAKLMVELSKNGFTPEASNPTYLYKEYRGQFQYLSLHDQQYMGGTQSSVGVTVSIHPCRQRV